MATKPVLSYVRSTEVPLDLDNNHSIAQQSNGTLWTNKTALTNYADTLYVHPSSDVYLYIKCGCGEEYSYVNKAAVPSDDVVCSCGRNIIKYSS